MSTAAVRRVSTTWGWSGKVDFCSVFDGILWFICGDRVIEDGAGTDVVCRNVSYGFAMFIDR